MNLSLIRSRSRWPEVILFSALVTSLFFFLGLASPFRLITSLWFLLVCPGMAFVKLLRFDQAYYEWTLAIALSIALDGLVACLLLYTGLWSIRWGLMTVTMISLMGAFLQIIKSLPEPIQNQFKQYLIPKRNMTVGLRCPKCHAEKKQTKAGFSRAGRQRYRCGQCRRTYIPHLKPRVYASQTRTFAIRPVWKLHPQDIINRVKRYIAKLPTATLK